MTPETKHTPAPWIIKYTPGSKVNSHVILEKENHNSIAKVMQQCNESEEEANARLIAAAPELLAALEKIAQIAQDGVLMSNDSKTGESWHILDALKVITAAAIAKAEG